jgi:DNA polymerase-3 subunit gamma/tau
MNGPPSYRVLARKYRPAAFSELIGQEAMVRTLTNAIRLGRLAHAFVLTGVRGVGKTTTARIIARALNCVGPNDDPAFGPTAEPCGACRHCTAIGEDRHVDVIEMDAASRTGVDNIRELLDGVRYRPTTARTKVYIIDEVHMLSDKAFNALLKTLEEPPEHVKFVFATTEVRKIPVTVLSRCQRFDLRRVPAERLAAHFADIALKEGAAVSEGALRLIARAADGSVRDGLSLLDQAISDGGREGGGEVGEEEVRRMLGLADRTLTFDLLEAALGGDARRALELLADQHAAGADPQQVLEDALELVHWITRLKVAPEAAHSAFVPEAERVRGLAIAEGLTMAAAARAWQVLLKGLNEVRLAPAPEQAAEMVLVRLAYASTLPTPAEALSAVADGGAPWAAGGIAGAAPPTPAGDSRPPPAGRASAARSTAGPAPAVGAEPAARPASEARPDSARGAGRGAAAEHPLVKAVMQTFPGATIGEVRTLGEPAPGEEDDEG